MSNSDSVHIDPAVAAAGIQQWEAADGALGEAVRARLATISGLEAGSPWGADGAGAQFAADYPGTSGEVAQGIRDARGRLTEVGQGAKTAIGDSLASDEEQAAPVQATDGQFTGQPAAGGGSGGGSGGGAGGGGGGGGSAGGGGGSTSAASSAFLTAAPGGQGQQGQARLVEDTARVVPVEGRGEDAELVRAEVLRAEVLRAEVVETQQGQDAQAEGQVVEAQLVQAQPTEQAEVLAQPAVVEEDGPRPSIAAALMPGSEPRPTT